MRNLACYIYSVFASPVGGVETPDVSTDALTARLAYVIVSATVLIFTAQGVRFIIQSGALS